MWGGRDFEGTIDNMYTLDIDSMTWDQVKLTNSLARPMPVFSHCAEAVQSATSWKVFAFGGRRAPFDYCSTVFALDTTKMSWWNPQAPSPDQPQPQPQPRRNTLPFALCVCGA